MTNPGPVWLELPDAAVKAALEEIWFDDPLSQEIKRLLRSVEGHIRAYLPEGITIERALEIRAGGLVEPGQMYPLAEGMFEAVNADLVEERDSRFETLLHDDPGAVCIIPEFNPRLTDPNPPTDESVFWVGGRCYHWVQGPEANTSQAFDIAELFWNGFALISRPPQGAIRARDATAAGLRLLADNVVEISFRAYDGEGFWLWSPVRRL